MKPFKDPPPPGALWDVPFAEANLALVDLEMTGLDLERDRVLEICIDRTDGGKPHDHFASLLNPDMPVGATHIHGIDQEMVKAAPQFAEVMAKVEAILTDAIFVAHAASYDVDFLNMEFARAKSAFRVTHFIDTLPLARRAFGLESHSMSALCKHFGVPQESAHRAASDVASLKAVFARIVATIGPASPRDLWEVRIAERLARASVMKACEEAKIAGSCVHITYRPSRRKAEVLDMIVTDVLSDLDPPRVMGYLVSGRSRRELRADRILRVEIPSS